MGQHRRGHEVGLEVRWSCASVRGGIEIERSTDDLLDDTLVDIYTWSELGSSSRVLPVRHRGSGHDADKARLSTK